MTVDARSAGKKVFEMLQEATSTVGYDPSLITTISSGYDILDLYTGGLPVGAPLVLVGNPGCGKSTLAASILGNLQRAYEDFASVYIDNEYSMTTDRLKLFGIENCILRSGLTLEEIEQVVNEFAKIKLDNNLTTPSVVVWDTYANTMTLKELEQDDPNKSTGWRVRLLGHKLPKMILSCIKAQISLIIINQLRDLISMDSFVQPAKELRYMRYGKDMPGGNPLKFNAFTLLDMKDIGLIPETYGFHGSFVEVTTVKCKLRASGTKFKLVLDHKKGFSNLYSKFEFLVQRKAIVSAGGYRKLKNDVTKSFLVRNLEEMYNNNPEFKKSFDELYEQESNEVLKELGESIISIATDSSSTDKNTDELKTETGKSNDKQVKSLQELLLERPTKE